IVANRAVLIDHLLRHAGSIKVPVIGLGLPRWLPVSFIKKLSPHLLRSDHAPFWEKGIPAVMWTDTAEFRNPHYHLPTDTPETLDYEFMAEIGKLLTIAVSSAAPAL